MINLKYCTVLNIINSFERHGRIFKFLHKNSKLFLLKHRFDSVENQKLYKKYRNSRLIKSKDLRHDSQKTKKDVHQAEAA